MDQFHTGLHVRDLHHFRRRMNVSARNGHAAGVNAGTGHMDRTCIGAAGTNYVGLVRDLLFLREFGQLLDHLGIPSVPYGMAAAKGKKSFFVLATVIPSQ